MGRISAILALVTGVTLAIAETALNWGRWQPWPYFVIDYLCAALIVTGGYRTLKKMKGGLRLLAGGWGVTAGMGWMALAFTLEEGSAPAWYLGLVGALVVAAAIGLLLAVLHKEG
jgi:hypothetical protein